MQFLLFCLSLLPLSALAHPFPLCNCGLGSGEDVCSNSNNNKKCTPLVVRPMDVPKPILPTPKVVCAPVGGVPPLVPIGGPCSCHTSLVKPAVVPKPQCACGYGGRIDLSNDRQLTLSQKQQILFGGGCSGGGADKVIMTTAEARPILVDDVVETGSNNPADYVPADPVSVALAYKMAQESCNHNEDKLSFGFRSLPKDVPLYIKKRVNDIPEGDLYNLNGQIVELKKLKCASGKSVDEEAAEELLALADEEEEAKLATTNQLMKRVTLGEIGYAPAKIKSPAFVDIPAAGAPLDAALTDGLKDCDDGFKPGHVVISQVPKVDTFSLPVPLPEPCAEEGEPFLPPPPSIPSGAVFTSPYTYMSSSSSSSSAMKNKFSQSVILQKLGGGGGCFN